MKLFDGLRSAFGPRPTTSPAPINSAIRIVAISRILDESDVVEAFVRHTAQYVSAHLFMDNGSQDGTLEILQNLKAEGFNIKVWQNKSVSFNETNFNTFLYQRALSEFSADWIFCLDVDEFIDDRNVGGGLLSAITEAHQLQPDVLGFDVPLTENRRSRGDDVSDILVPSRIRRRAEVTDNTKVFFSGSRIGPKATVRDGNHFVHVGAERQTFIRLPGLAIAHFAERSAYQGAVKFIKGWAKALAAGPELLQQGASIHYKQPFRTLRDDPGALFRQKDFLESPDNLHLTEDPIAYRGGALRYTPPPDEAMRAVRMLMGHIEELSSRHGLLIHASREAKHIVDTWNADIKVAIGDEPS